MPHLIRVVTACLFLLVSAAPGEAQRQKLRIALPLFGAQVVMDTIGEALVVNAPPGKVFTASRMVLTNYKIAPDVMDSVGGLVGAAKLVTSRTLAGSALSRFLECGSSMTGPRADSYRVSMPLILLIEPAPEGKSTLRVALVASAQDRSGTSNAPVLCGSTGALESMLRKAINSQLLEIP